MKVLTLLHRWYTSRTTLRVVTTIRPTLALAVVVTACHASIITPVAQVTVPPVEAVDLRVSLSNEETQALVRNVLFNVGVQVTAANRREGWMRSSLGGIWEDRYRYKQWRLVFNFRTETVTYGTLVTVRAVQQATSYPAGVTRTTTAVLAPNGFTQTAIINELAQGDARAAWLTLERIALALADTGAELLTDFRSRAP